MNRQQRKERPKGKTISELAKEPPSYNSYEEMMEEEYSIPLDENGLTWEDAFIDVIQEKASTRFGGNYKAQRGTKWCTGKFSLPKVGETKQLRVSGLLEGELSDTFRTSTR